MQVQLVMTSIKGLMWVANIETFNHVHVCTRKSSTSNQLSIPGREGKVGTKRQSEKKKKHPMCSRIMARCFWPTLPNSTCTFLSTSFPREDVGIVEIVMTPGCTHDLHSHCEGFLRHRQEGRVGFPSKYVTVLGVSIWSEHSSYEII